VAVGSEVFCGGICRGPFVLARFLPNGQLDATFGTGGIVRTGIRRHAVPSAVGLQLDGKLVVAGASLAINSITGGDESVYALARYLPNGSLDAAFGSGGIVITPVGTGNDFGRGLVLQSDGKIILVGFAETGATGYDMALVRYTASGGLDPSFGNAGKVLTPVGSGRDEAWSILLQNDGRIVVAGSAIVAGSTDFALVRYLTDGALDPNFGAGGKQTTPLRSFQTTDTAYSLTAQADGKLIAAGYVQNSTAGLDFALVRYLTDGSLDTTFGTGGKVNTLLSGSQAAYDVAIQQNGKIVIAGVTDGNSTFQDFAVLRYLPDGSLDSSFGTAGIVTTDFVGNFNDQAASVTIGDDGRIIVAGTAGTESFNKFALARYVGDPVPVPEPSTTALLITITGLLVASRRRPIIDNL